MSPSDADATLLRELAEALRDLWRELMDPVVVIARMRRSDEPLSRARQALSNYEARQAWKDRP
jgi:hypothetical protein